MRFLVINPDPSYASLIGSALKRLGHRPVTCRPADALARLAAQPFDGVIAQASSATAELAERLNTAAVPLALSGVSEPLAADIVATLPRVWTQVDLRRVVDQLVAEGRRLAQGSSPAVELDIGDDGVDAAL